MQYVTPTRYPLPPHRLLGSGGLRASDCQVELQICYRNDDATALPSILIKLSQPVPSPPAPPLATVAWILTLSNGWGLYAKLYNVSDACECELVGGPGVSRGSSGQACVLSPWPPRPSLPATDPLTFATSLNNGSSWTVGGTVTAPAATACVTTLSSPVFSPLGFSSVGPVVVTIITTAPGAATYYQLTGAGYSPSKLYTGPFVLDDPGNTTVLAYSARAGALSSATVIATYVISLSSNPNVTAQGVSCSPYGASGGRGAAGQSQGSGGARMPRLQARSPTRARTL